MGKAYQDGDTVVVELSAGDVVKRYFETDGKAQMSLHEAIRKIAWKIVCTHPTGQKLVYGKEWKWATVEALDGMFAVVFRKDDPDLSGEPGISIPCHN